MSSHQSTAALVNSLDYYKLSVNPVLTAVGATVQIGGVYLPLSIERSNQCPPSDAGILKHG